MSPTSEEPLNESSEDSQSDIQIPSSRAVEENLSQGTPDLESGNHGTPDLESGYQRTPDLEAGIQGAPDMGAENLPQQDPPHDKSRAYKGLVAGISIIGAAGYASFSDPPKKLEQATKGYKFSLYCTWGFLCFILSLAVVYLLTLDRAGRKCLISCVAIALFSLALSGYIGLNSMGVAFSTFIATTVISAVFFCLLILAPLCPKR